MTTKDDGQIETETVGSHGKYQDRSCNYSHMTLRDYFAAKAMHAFITANPFRSNIAIDAYAQADIMLAARDGNS